METATIDASFQAMPEFAVFRDIVAENIGYVPRILFDHISLSGHRVQKFRNPPGVNIYYSQRSLARYIELADIFWGARQRESSEVLAAGLMALKGGDFLRQDRSAGLALVALGFKQISFNKVPYPEIIQKAVQQRDASLGSRMFQLASLFLPLAHEIGHVPEAQAIGPKAIYSDEILETYRINLLRVQQFTGTFDYAPSLQDPHSPLQLSTLREECTSDYFAVSALCWLVARTAKPGEAYPLNELITELFSLPLLMTLDSVCLLGPRSSRSIQELTLAMHCRYSIIIDSARSALKGLFKNRANQREVFELIDTCIDGTEKAFRDLYEMVWKAITSFSNELNHVAELDEAGLLRCFADATADVRRQLAIAEFLDVVSADVDGYSVSSDNLGELRQYGNQLRTFDTVIIEDNGVRLIR